ncbi:pectinesterase [Microdochium trichocladiopsis]|uniref:Pectinesterase n=1 Tax=Microdochium trichocladiopsis TaxID=1682393 RepID=A0A9P9BP51_9PEZI|nr:pectinesterase [Microdochium trichocladiopsis]KAH7028179.1 pectinesterase [Microdochium trichocladiopsis]
MKSSIATFWGLATTVLAVGRTSAPAGCLNVAKSGGQFSTIQAAVNSLSTSASGKQCIFVNPGTYTEQVLVPARTAQLTIYGYTTDTSSYTNNQVVITGRRSQADGVNNDNTATLRVKANGFKLYNVIVRNTYGEGSQAVALSAYADSGYYGCSLEGYQDTLLANVGSQVYARTRIVGATDFIFGQQARAWFERCDLRGLARQTGIVTANGRDGDSNPSYYAFNRCDLRAADGQNVAAGSYFLGRPWRDYARVVFQNTAMSSILNGAGWQKWTSDQDVSKVFYGEYGNTGAGASGSRASWTRKLGSPVTLAEVLGSNYASAAWYDGSYMS